MNGSDPKQTARDLLVEAHPALVGLSHWIHANPELGYQEVLSSGWVADWMTSAGFEVRRNVAGMETALAASFGSGPFHVALCAEYDALPAVGHACGHNVIAAASVGAAIALASVADELGLRVTLFGTPAEEGGGGKLVLIEAGEFDTVHAALMVHPGPDDILEPEILGVRTLNVAYTGREAHAAGFPELGINALDALTVAQVAIGLLRQQLETGDRVHGIVTRGGDAPNIIPARTGATFMVRSRTRGGLDAITQRVAACFEAGALATGAALELTQEVAYSPMLHDPDLVALYRLNAEAHRPVVRSVGTDDGLDRHGRRLARGAVDPPDDRHRVAAIRQPPARVRGRFRRAGRGPGDLRWRAPARLDRHRRRDQRPGSRATHRIRMAPGRSTRGGWDR